MSPRALARLRELSRDQRIELIRLLEARETLQRNRGEGLFGFIPRVSPDRVAPEHLARVARIFERIAAGERVRACISIPPQHGKTEMVLHAIAWLLALHPGWRLAYGSYQQEQSDDKSHAARAIARRAGVALSADRQNLRMWRTELGGGCLFTSVGGPATGQPAQVFLIDDPYKGRTEAMSATVRETVERWFTSVVLQRGQEDMSVVIVHTRWIEDDLIGRIEKGAFGEGWQIVNLPLLATGDGEPAPRPYDTATRVLNPRTVLASGMTFGWTLEGARKHLLALPAEDAEALGQGRPRTRTQGALWNWDLIEAGRVAQAPPLRRAVVSIDPAATAHKKSDATGIVAAGVGMDGRGYVLRDRTGKYSPGAWGEIAVRMFDELGADAIVGEMNHGGDMIEHVVRTAAEDLFRRGMRPTKHVVYRSVRATRSGAVRAEPIAHLYERAMVSHVGNLPELEGQATGWDPAVDAHIPDALSALVWGLTDLMLGGAITAESWSEPYQD